MEVTRSCVGEGWVLRSLTFVIERPFKPFFGEQGIAL